MIFLATGAWSAKFDKMLQDISLKRANRSHQEYSHVLTANRVRMAFVLARAIVLYILGTRNYRRRRTSAVSDDPISFETHLSEVVRASSSHAY